MPSSVLSTAAGGGGAGFIVDDHGIHDPAELIGLVGEVIDDLGLDHDHVDVEIDRTPARDPGRGRGR